MNEKRKMELSVGAVDSGTTAGRRFVATVVAPSFLLLGACGGGDDGPSAADLIGTWEVPGSDVRWEVTDDVIATTFGGGIETAYTATDTTLELGAESGERACAPGQVGVYEWAIDDDVLTMSLVSDDCRGRGTTIDGMSLERTG